MNIYFRCLESRIDKNNTLYGKFNLTSIPSGQGNTFANALRRSLFSDLSGLAITHFCITSNPGLGYEFATIPGLAESVLDFSLNLKKVVLTGRLTGAFSTCYKMDKDTLSQSPEYQNLDLLGYPSPSCLRFPLVNSNPRSADRNRRFIKMNTFGSCLSFAVPRTPYLMAKQRYKVHKGIGNPVHLRCKESQAKIIPSYLRFPKAKDLKVKELKVSSKLRCTGGALIEDAQPLVAPPISKSNTPSAIKGFKYAAQGLSKENQGKKGKVLHQENVIKKNSSLGSPVKENKKYNVQNFSPLAPVGFLKAKGPTILRACDLVLPPGIRCVHPDQYLGTLAADSALSIKFLIAAGKGYIVQDETFYKSLSRAKLLLASRNSKSPIFSTSCVAFAVGDHPFRRRKAKLRSPLSFAYTPIPLYPEGVRGTGYGNPMHLIPKVRCKESEAKITPFLPTVSFGDGASPRLYPYTPIPRTPFAFGDHPVPLRLGDAPYLIAKLRYKVHRGKGVKGYRGTGYAREAKLKTVFSLKAIGSWSYLHLPRKPLNTLNQRCKTEDKLQIMATSTNKDRALDQGKKVKNLQYLRHRCIDPINESSGAIFIPHESKLHSVAQKKFKIITKKRSHRFAFRGILSQKSINQEQSLTRLNDNERLSRKQLIWGAQDKLHPVLPLDATFTPISKVNFQIDIDRNTEKSEETIVFEIWTNGSITPKRAIQESCLALAQDFYSLFSSVNGFSNLHSWWKRESLQFYPRQLS